MTTKHDVILDFDETLFDTARHMRMFLNYRFGIEIPTDTPEYMCGHGLLEFVTKYLPTECNLSREDFYEILGNEFLTCKFWHADIVPVTGVLEVIPELAKKYRLHIATARQSSSAPVVDMMIEKFFPGLISSTHFVWKHLGNKQFEGVPKKEFIRTLKSPIAYVDDNPKETKEVGELLSHVILFDPHGYHVEIQSGASHHVSHWEEIKTLLL